MAQYLNQNFYKYILANRFAIKEKAIHHITVCMKLRLFAKAFVQITTTQLFIHANVIEENQKQ